jgi:DNA invertase Pin-like site-specific DNA recombinase
MWTWSRLGRSIALALIDLLGSLGELHSKGVDLFLHQQGLDTSTPSGRELSVGVGTVLTAEA